MMFRKSILLLSVLCLLSCSYGQQQHKYTLFCGTAYETPLNLSDTWDPFPTFGAGFQCPTSDSNMTIGFSAYYGNLKSDTISVTNPMLHTEISLNYLFRLPSDVISFSATLALIDWAVKIPAEKPSDNISLIASWENEFGVSAGAAVNLHKIRNLIVSVPLRGSVIFSSPDYFYSFSFGLTIGYQLHAGKNE